ncbi:sensor domain-containing diguanylate cyclase [Lampropedia puyangensis]|uniref:diguanylate cyclase n=1 Tax=Lampropedia puyangensis TaxID=1330072 RepID=A0A4S8EW26_9BURK|nr:sensor domain-containing diguanylate cyclase [Lampropedia puyangensis]THT99002.1 sensor domain-containing diguanylate cyclase [Lampropedia puyangensis]
MYPTAIFEFLDVIPIPALAAEMTGDDNSFNHPRFLNAAFLAQIGYTLDEIPDIERWFEVAYPDPVMRAQVRQEWYQAIHESLAQGRQIAETSALIQCKSGQQRWFVVTAQVRPESMPNMHIVTFRDIHDLKMLSDENHFLSHTDQLTHVSNRRAGQQRLEAEHARFTQAAVPFALIMCDVDHFKSINDQMGHVCGDYVLRKIAETLHMHAGNLDEVVRWGGDEFLLVVPATGVEEAAALAEQLRMAVQSLNCSWEGQTFSPTLSVGCAVSAPGQSVVALLKTVDAALYAAKQQGRNAVCF